MQAHLADKAVLSKLVQLSPVVQGILVQGLNIHTFHQDKGTEVSGGENPQHSLSHVVPGWAETNGSCKVVPSIAFDEHLHTLVPTEPAWGHCFCLVVWLV